jgi:hypothetical protein
MRWGSDTAGAGANGDLRQLLKGWMPALLFIVCAIILYNYARTPRQSTQQASTAYPFTGVLLRLFAVVMHNQN